MHVSLLVLKTKNSNLAQNFIDSLSLGLFEIIEIIFSDEIYTQNLQNQSRYLCCLYEKKVR
jgi:hypothetical protein